MIVIELHGVQPLTANDARKWNHHRLGRATTALRTQLEMAGRERWGRVGWPSFDVPVHVTLQVRPPDRIHRDTDGWYPTLKAALDVAVRHGVLPDDCTCHVHRTSCEPLPVGRRWMVRLLIDPVEGGPDVAEPSTETCNSRPVIIDQRGAA